MRFNMFYNDQLYLHKNGAQLTQQCNTKTQHKNICFAGSKHLSLPD